MLPPGCPIRIPTDQSRLRLPVDFRSLLRPSSPDGAKASVVCPYTLDRRKTDRLSGSRCIRCNSSTQKLCSFQGTTAAHGPALRVPRPRGKRLQNRLGRRLRRAAGLVGVTGIGPVTSSLSGTRSNQLSYTPSLVASHQWIVTSGDCRAPRGNLDGFRSRRDATDQTVCWLRFARTLSGPARDGSRRPGSPGIASRDVSVLLRKEVIQPQVPLRLPCYDFIPITTHTLDTCPPCGLARRLWVQTAFMM